MKRNRTKEGIKRRSRVEVAGDYLPVTFAVFGIGLLAFDRWTGDSAHFWLILPVVLQVIVMEWQKSWQGKLHLLIDSKNLIFTKGKLEEGEAEKIVEALKK